MGALEAVWKFAIYRGGARIASRRVGTGARFVMWLGVVSSTTILDFRSHRALREPQSERHLYDANFQTASKNLPQKFVNTMCYFLRKSL
uniref:Uncharacterized protein n=1 Tax=Candidatus Kentrum eta TaxID=2126337 RepID=A0A450ULH1_9GAMM|nr:MAG: hypothetical protein BECKH772A_GA0070896_1005610 [Candidatus Kentron sp. H]VFJ94109.1 MAG: hypothetical protein BECKH772B_GA0070898_1005511 [Candidatus Kentron sp. H]VFK02268.1 MAG: hypothetical protein BECKH772C_GA0070978_100864 [Candidatus Kentron sp. H]